METRPSYIKHAIRSVKRMAAEHPHFTDANFKRNNDFFPFYASTNENLSYLADLHVDGGDALTVTGSGDQAFNLAYFGAKSIETFDINPLAIIAFDLKKTALLHLTRNEFLDFYTTPHFLNRKLYKKIYPYLKEITKAVFDTILMDAKKDENFFKYVEELYVVNDNLLNNPYLSSEAAYKETQRRVNNLTLPINHKKCAVNRIGTFFSQKDVVILSNILDFCIYGSYDKDSYNFNTQNKRDNFVKSLSRTLSEKGTVSLLYMFSNQYSEEEIQKLFGIKTHIEKVRGTGFRASNYIHLANKNDFPSFEESGETKTPGQMGE